MNRSLANVILGGYGTPAPTASASGPAEKLVHVEADVDQVAEALMGAKSVIIAPGYGLAVARAQARADGGRRPAGRGRLRGPSLIHLWFSGGR